MQCTMPEISSYNEFFRHFAFSDSGYETGNDQEHSFDAPEEDVSSNSHRQQTANWRKFLEETGDVHDRVLKILRYIYSLKINLPILLWVISWNVEALTADLMIKFARTTLMVSKELPDIIRHWHTPP
jgi:hypothetical protein